MSLKQHNMIVQKLIKQLDAKDSEIQSLKKQLHKAGAMVIPNKNIETEKEWNKKINQLHKQYKDKINTLTQQIRSKSNENKDLKQRLNVKKNMEAKQKQKVGEVLKKTSLMAAQDPKIAALVSHYEYEIERKDKHIATLQKQIKQNYYKNKNQSKENRQYDEENQEENDQPVHENIKEQSKIPHIINQQHYHTKYQQEINSLKADCNKYQRLLQEKSKEFKNLTKRYSDLTKQYYKILNQYGAKEKPIDQNSVSSGMMKNKTKTKNMDIGIGNTLEEMLDKFDNEDRSQVDASLSYSFLSNYNKNKKQNGERNGKEFDTNQRQLQALQDLIENIMELLCVESRVQVIPALTKIKAKCQQTSVYENISKFVHSMLYRMGMGKIPMSELIPELEKFQQKINKYLQASDLLDEVCIQVGAKKQKVLEKIKDFKATQQQFFNNMKDISFMQQLPRANKIVQFIQYFQLDKQICELPQQLKKMYEQLKYVDKFLKQAALILEREPQGLERSLESILRYLERKQAEEAMIKDERQISNGKKNKK